MAKITSLARVKGTGEVIAVNTDFYQGLLALKEAGAYLITPRDEAKARIVTALDEKIGRNYGTWTTVGFEYFKGNPVLLRLRSRLMNPKLAKQAVEANRQNQYFSSDARFYEESAKQADKDKNEEPRNRKVLVLPSRTNFQITSRANMEVLEFLMRDPQLAKDYFRFNGFVPINTYLVDKDTVNAQDGTLMTQLWLYRLGDGGRSDLGGDFNNLYASHRIHGKQTGKASSQKTPQVFSYTPQHLRVLIKVLHAQGITEELEKRIVEGVKQ